MGDCGGNGPSKASAGDSGRLPGIVSKPDRVTGEDEPMTARISWWTDDVSQLSNALSTVIASPTGNGTGSNDERLECWMSFVLDEPGPTLVDDDRVIEPPLETGVLGGE
jgi:hypothetical protein